MHLLLQIRCKITSLDRLFAGCCYNFDWERVLATGPGGHKNLATSASMASGEVVEAQRWTTLPSLSIRNFSKFHCRREQTSVLRVRCKRRPGCYSREDAMSPAWDLGGRDERER